MWQQITYLGSTDNIALILFFGDVMFILRLIFVIAFWKAIENALITSHHSQDLMKAQVCGTLLRFI
jgi:hypothetical protein